jgi:hypothetical protein
MGAICPHVIPEEINKETRADAQTGENMRTWSEEYRA